jgi:hypothetical protein
MVGKINNLNRNTKKSGIPILIPCKLFFFFISEKAKVKITLTRKELLNKLITNKNKFYFQRL